MAGHTHHHPHDGHHHDHHHGVVHNIRIAFFLNLGFAVVELIGGLLTNSMAILTDALHDLGDALGLGLSWYLEKVSGRRRDQTFTYGYARFSVLAALINAVILIVGATLLIAETIPRLITPQPSNAQGMLALAVLGLAVNGFAAWRLLKGATLNERAVALHLLEDVLGWLAIVIGAVVMLFWDVPILDPILSCAIMVFILINVFRNLKQVFLILLQASPTGLDQGRVHQALQGVPNICNVHDLRVWTLDGTQHVASLHVTVGRDATWQDAERLKKEIRAALLPLRITHATIEMESEDSECVFQMGGRESESNAHSDHDDDHVH
jgi:cobalt-zinc-cadmium efflux system protein